MNKLGIFLFLTVVLLSLIGIFILYESSTYTALLSLGDKFYFFKNQTAWFVMGVILCVVVSKIDYKMYYKMALPLLLGTVVLLCLVFLPGIGLELKGAHRWINLGFTVFQPSELMKVTLTIYLAAWLSVKEKGRLLAFLMLFGASTMLVILEPDMGTGFIIASTSIVVYFLSGAPKKDIALIFLFGIIAVFALIKLEPYRVARLASFQNFDSSDLSTTSYHVKQILVALGSGGVAGVGFGNSIQKYAYLPESTTDSIFAIYAEEAGFIGSVIFIGIFVIMAVLGFAIAAQTSDMFGKLLGAGIITFISIQAFINMASQVVLIPLTGIPLPFISYGGSSLVINFISMGVLINIARGIKK